MAGTLISQHEGQPSGIVVHYVSTEVAPLKALYIFCPVKGCERGLFIRFVLAEKNSGRYLTMFFPKVVDFVKKWGHRCLEFNKAALFSRKEAFDLDLLQIVGAPAPLTSDKERVTNLSDPNHLKPKNLLCDRFAYVRTSAVSINTLIAIRSTQSVTGYLMFCVFQTS